MLMLRIRVSLKFRYRFIVPKKQIFKMIFFGTYKWAKMGPKTSFSFAYTPEFCPEKYAEQWAYCMCKNRFTTKQNQKMKKVKIY